MGENERSHAKIIRKKPWEINSHSWIEMLSRDGRIIYTDLFDNFLTSGKVPPTHGMLNRDIGKIAVACGNKHVLIALEHKTTLGK